MHLERITINPQQCGGRPCIRGLRIRVQDILELLAAGATTAEILEDYPPTWSPKISPPAFITLRSKRTTPFFMWPDAVF